MYLVIIAVIALVVLVLMPRGEESYEEFVAQASRTAGHIVRKEEKWNPAIKRSEYLVTYAYTDDKGINRTTQTKLEYPDLWKRLREGQVENVYYNKNNPSRSYLEMVLERRMGKTIGSPAR